MESLMRKRKVRNLKPINTTSTTRRRNSSTTAATDDDQMEPLSPGSRIFHEQDFNVHVLAIIGTKLPININIIKQKLPQTLLKHPRFTSLVIGDPDKSDVLTWSKSVVVNLDDHVIVPEINYSLIQPGTLMADKFVDDYIYNLTKTRLDRSRPLWDLHILKIQTTSNEEGIGILRIHHSLGDGTSLMSLLLACTRKASDPSSVPTIPSKVKKEKKISDDGVWRRVLVWLWCVIELCRNTIVDVLMFIATVMFLKDSDTPIKGKTGVDYSKRPRRVVYKSFSMEDIKFIKNIMNATINDVALGITQAGLSRYINRKYENGHQTNKKIRLRSTLLINLRPSPGIQALADMMENDTKSAKWGNWIGYALLPLTIQSHDHDPLHYVRLAKATVDRKKRSLEAIYTFSITQLFLKLLGNKLANALSHRVITHTTLCFSNLVGPVEEIAFYGHPMKFLAPACYGQPHGLMINFVSYIDKMTVVLSVDPDIIPDYQQLCQDIVDSLDLIKKAAAAAVANTNGD